MCRPGYISGLLHRFGPIPLSMILIVVLALLWFFFKNTKKGFSIYAIGSNESAARLNGISILRTKMLAYGFREVLRLWPACSGPLRWPAALQPQEQIS